MKIQYNNCSPDKRGPLKNREFKLLFSPLTIGSMTLKNRFVFSAITLTTMPKEKFIEMLRIRAAGGVGLVIIGAGMLMRDATDNFFRIYSDEFLPELSRLAGVIHSAGAKVGIQVHHQGRQTHFSGTPVAPSPIPCPVVRRMPGLMTTEQVLYYIEEYAEGVRRAKEAGFDTAELHAAHGYLIHEFLSARSNQRTDEYGGDIRRRARFLIEIIKRARQKVGDSYPIGCRFNAVDHIEGGLTPDESCVIARLAEEAGLSMLNISGGVYGSYPVTIAPFYSPEALFAEPAAEIKKVLKIPICVTGRIGSPQLAEEIIKKSKSDLVAMVRPLLADPQLPSKAAEGKIDEIRPCLFCNQGCMKGLDFGQEDTCTVNPWMACESEIDLNPASKVKKVVIAGGGIAGLECARVASLRGHRVIIFEKESTLGGQWKLAAIPPMKEHYRLYLDWLLNQVKKTGVEMRTGKAVAEEDILREKPDVFVIASGATPAIPPVRGAELAVTAWDILQEKVKVKEKALIVGASGTGLETAHYLAEKGQKVTVIEMTDRIAKDMPSSVRWHLRHLLDDYKVKILRQIELKEIRPNGVLVKSKDIEELMTGFDTVILATGVRPRNEFKSSIQEKVPEVYIIGDARQPRSGLEAIAEGADIGLRI